IRALPERRVEATVFGSRDATSDRQRGQITLDDVVVVQVGDGIERRGSLRLPIGRRLEVPATASARAIASYAAATSQSSWPPSSVSA
ncbi:MAG: hypothetical protein WEC14_06440, partial [Chloroflexota bacterium]